MFRAFSFYRSSAGWIGALAGFAVVVGLLCHPGAISDKPVEIWPAELVGLVLGAPAGFLLAFLGRAWLVELIRLGSPAEGKAGLRPYEDHASIPAGKPRQQTISGWNSEKSPALALAASLVIVFASYTLYTQFVGSPFESRDSSLAPSSASSSLQVPADRLAELLYPGARLEAIGANGGWLQLSTPDKREKIESYYSARLGGSATDLHGARAFSGLVEGRSGRIQVAVAGSRPQCRIAIKWINAGIGVSTFQAAPVLRNQMPVTRGPILPARI